MLTSCTIGSEKFAKENLKEIIFGCMMPAHDRQEIIELVKEIYPNIIFKEAKIDIQSYSINIIDLDN